MSISIIFPASIDPEEDLSALDKDFKAAGVTTAIISLDEPSTILIQCEPADAAQVFRILSDWEFD